MTTPGKLRKHHRFSSHQDAEDKIDTVIVTQEDTGQSPVNREVFVLGDAETGGARLNVVKGRANDTYGFVIAGREIVAINETLKNVYLELRKIREHMNQITEYEDD